MAMFSLRRISLCILLFSVQLFAQSSPGINRPAATAPLFEAGVGYAFMSMTSPSTSRVNLNGINADGSVRFSPRWAGAVDLTYVRSGGLPVTGHTDSVLSGLVGPVFYLAEHGKTTIFVHGLVGFAWVDSAVPISSTSFFSGYETRFSYLLGGGVERALTGPFALRAGVDYQRTSFVNSTLALEGQKNIRLTLGVQYRFGNRFGNR